MRARIAAACERSGRDPAQVRIVAVTKSVDAEAVAELHAAGLREFAENRPQVLWEKRAAVEALLGRDETVRWHMIGHMQRNKVRRTLPLVDCVQSCGSVRLLRKLDEEAARLARPALAVLLQVNVAGEAQKDGFDPADLPAALAAAAELTHVSLQGLMCMAPETADAGTLRDVFARLKELRDDPANQRYLERLDLSMGMSGDFEVAVEQGATVVRLGRVLFVGARCAARR